MKTNVSDEINRLVHNIVHVLAPEVLDAMCNLGYEVGFNYCDKNGGEHTIIKEDIQNLIERQELYFTPYNISHCDSFNDLVDKRHHSVLYEFSRLKDILLALHKRRDAITEANKWTEGIGIFYERKVITEKFKSA